MDSLTDATVCALKRGYAYREDSRAFACLYCEQQYEQGEIYRTGERLLDARKAMEEHIRAAHGSAFHSLIGEDKRATGLTEVQKGYMLSFYEGRTDQEIARATGASQSTVRYQRFMLRERAKQARAFLALSELMERRAKGGHPPVHRGATMVDERYMVTDEEERRIVAAAFSSLDPLVLADFPSKQKKKLVVLRMIARQFDPGAAYSEKRMNEILKPIYHDFAAIRRYLIEYGFMSRTPDGGEYRLK